jgi:hypothetical protein
VCRTGAPQFDCSIDTTGSHERCSRVAVNAVDNIAVPTQRTHEATWGVKRRGRGGAWVGWDRRNNWVFAETKGLLGRHASMQHSCTHLSLRDVAIAQVATLLSSPSNSPSSPPPLLCPATLYPRHHHPPVYRSQMKRRPSSLPAATMDWSGPTNDTSLIVFRLTAPRYLMVKRMGGGRGGVGGREGRLVSG